MTHCPTCNGLIATSCPTCVIGKVSQSWLDEAMRLAEDFAYEHVELCERGMSAGTARAALLSHLSKR